MKIAARVSPVAPARWRWQKLGSRNAGNQVRSVRGEQIVFAAKCSVKPLHIGGKRFSPALFKTSSRLVHLQAIHRLESWSDVQVITFFGEKIRYEDPAR